MQKLTIKIDNLLYKLNNNEKIKNLLDFEYIGYNSITKYLLKEKIIPTRNNRIALLSFLEQKKITNMFNKDIYTIRYKIKENKHFFDNIMNLDIKKIYIKNNSDKIEECFEYLKEKYALISLLVGSGEYNKFNKTILTELEKDKLRIFIKETLKIIYKDGPINISYEGSTPEYNFSQRSNLNKEYPFSEKSNFDNFDFGAVEYIYKIIEEIQDKQIYTENKFLFFTKIEENKENKLLKENLIEFYINSDINKEIIELIKKQEFYN